MTARPAPSRSAAHPAGRRRAPLAVAALVAISALAACSGGSDSAASSGGGSASRPDAAAALAGRAEAAAASAGGKAAAAPPRGAAAAEPRRQVRTGDLSVRVPDVGAAVARVRSLAAAADGYVGEERTTTDPGPAGGAAAGARSASRTTSQLTLRVPEGSLERVMGQVGALGTVLSRASSSTDVSGTYVDTQARLRTQRDSVARVRALLGRATTIGQVVQVEAQLASRTADLEALEARLANLADQTTLATLRVSLTPPPPAAAKAVVADGTGFLGGLRAGARALAATTATVLVVLGALLPFALVAAVVAAPVWWLARRRRLRTAPNA